MTATNSVSYEQWLAAAQAQAEAEWAHNQDKLAYAEAYQQDMEATSTHGYFSPEAKEARSRSRTLARRCTASSVVLSDARLAFAAACINYQGHKRS